MSKLLIDEQPLIVLPSLAKAIGLNEALILQQLNYWLKSKEDAEKNLRECDKSKKEGFYWVYNTYDQWHEQFPFISPKTIMRAIKSLEDSALVISTDKFNKLKIDKTKWYRINYDKIHELEKSMDNHSSAATTQNDQSNVQNDQSSGQSDQMDNSNRPNEEDNLSVPLPKSSTETTPKISTEISTEIYTRKKKNLSVSKTKDWRPMNDHTDGQTDYKFDLQELESIKSACELDIFNDHEERSILENILEKMYFAECITVDQAKYPKVIVRAKMHRLNGSILHSALSKAKENRGGIENITKSSNYLISCIYNEITEYSLDAVVKSNLKVKDQEIDNW